MIHGVVNADRLEGGEAILEQCDAAELSCARVHCMYHGGGKGSRFNVHLLSDTSYARTWQDEVITGHYIVKL